MVRSALVLLLGFGVSACASCSQSGDALSAPDGGGAAPTTKRDAGSDGAQASSDASGDDDGSSSFDGGDFDAGAGVNPFVGQWQTIPGAPAACTSAKLAVNPGASITPFAWKACASGRAGCQKLIVDWQSGPVETLDTGHVEPIRLINGSPWMLYSRVFSKLNPLTQERQRIALVSVVQPLGGTPIFALGSWLPTDTAKVPGDCSFAASLGESGIAIEASPNTNDPPPHVLAWSSWAQPNTFTSKVFGNNAFGVGATGGPTSNVMGSGSLFIATDGPQSVDIFDLATQQLIVPSSPSRLAAQRPHPTADGALVADFNSFAVVDFLRPDGSYAPIITAAAQEVADFTLDRSSGNAIVWVEGNGAAPVTNTVLWTSPYATLESAIQRRRVTAFTDTTGAAGGPLVANAGAVVLITSPTTAAVVRLADGASWTVQAESGDRFFAGLWIDDNEVWLSTGDATLNHPYENGMLRISRGTLGAPKPAQ